jgi:hypothetical protein
MVLNPCKYKTTPEQPGAEFVFNFYGYLLIPLFVWSTLCEGSYLGKRKDATLGFQLHVPYRDFTVSLNNFKLGKYVDHIYPFDLKIMDTTDTGKSAVYPK